MRDPEELLADLSPVQREAVSTTEGAVLILAGAGSGKTRVITYRIAYLLAACDVAPREILAMTFTNKAAREMKERVDDLIGLDLRDLWITTFHSFGARILRRHADLLERTSDFVIYDQDDSLRLVKRLQKTLGHDPKRFPPSQAVSWIEHRKTQGQGDESGEGASFLDRTYGRLHALYEEEMVRANAFDFADLLCRPLELCRDHEDLADHYRGRFRYILVDEYQDTNHAQYLLARDLSRHHGNVCVVGDEDQSIYSWRGADIRNILEFESDFGEEGIRSFHLVENFRSPRTVVEAASNLIRNNLRGHKKTKDLVSHRETPFKITCFQGMNAYHEATYVRDKVRSLAMQGARLSEIAIFYRTHAQSRVLEEVFRTADLAYKVFGGPKFFDRVEVKDLVAYLRVVANPRDRVALERAANVPKRGLGPASMAKLADAANLEGVTTYEMMRDGALLTGKAKKGCAQFVDLIEGLRSVRGELTLPELITRIIADTDYEAHLEAQGREDRLEIVLEFHNFVIEYEKWAASEGEEPTLEGFLEQTSLLSGADQIESDTGAITMMTLHNAKGLEYPFVFIVGLEEGLFPHASSFNDPTELEEERRLCYVGMTRAMERLFMTCALSRRLRGREMYPRPSRFLSEIPRELVDIDRSRPRRW